MIKALGYHTVAKIFVVLAAYMLHYSLGKILTVEEYGIVGTIITFCNFYYMFLTNGVRQGISKMLSAGKYISGEVVRKGILLQVAVSLFLSCVNYLSAPFFSEAFGDPEFAVYIRQISFLIPLTGIYFALTGALNGMKLFLFEALVISFYPLSRLLAVPLAFFAQENRASGVILGFTISSFCSAILAALFLKKKRRTDTDEKRESVSTKAMAKTSVGFILFFAANTLVLNLDTFFLQYIKKDTEQTGYYTGAHTFSLVPYYLISAFYLTILPFVSEKYEKGKKEEIRRLISKNINIIFTFVLPIALLISCTSKELLSCFYDSRYRCAGAALSLLCIGTFLLSFFAFLNVILNAVNGEKISRLISGVIIVLDVLLLYGVTPKWGITGAAAATLISAGVGCVGALYCLFRKLGCFWDKKLLARALFVNGIFALACRMVFMLFDVDHIIVLAGIYTFFGIAYLLTAIRTKILVLPDRFA